MGGLVIWLTNLTSTVVGYFGFQLATKTAFYLAAVVASVAMFAALASLCTGLFTGIASNITHPWLLQGIGLFVPWNASLCIAAYTTAAFANWMLRLGVMHVMIAARV